MPLSRTLRVACLSTLAASIYASGPPTETEAPETEATTKATTTEAPEEVAKIAGERYERLRKQVADNLADYEEAVSGFNASAGIDDKVAQITSAVEKQMGDEVDAARQHSKDALAALENWDGNYSTLENLGEAVEKTGKEEAEVDKEFAKATHHEYSRLRSLNKKQAEGPGVELKKQAEELKKAADELEKLQQKAGAQEKDYETEKGEHEKEAEHMESRAEKLKGEAEKKVEKFFGHVEKKVDHFDHRARHVGSEHKKEAEKVGHRAEKAVKQEEKMEKEEAKEEKKAAEKKAEKEKEAAEKEAEQEQEAAEKKAAVEKEAAKKEAEQEQEAAEKKAAAEKEAAEKEAEQEKEAAEKEAKDDATETPTDEPSADDVDEKLQGDAEVQNYAGLRDAKMIRLERVMERASALVMALAAMFVGTRVYRNRRTVNVAQTPLLG